jgi:predicted ABC-type ATPase
VPVLTLIAGPNGSGKSTVTGSVDIQGRDRLIDTDAIARRLSPSNPSAAAMKAGREVLKRIEDHLGADVDFAVETTLSSRKHADLISRAKLRGYEIHLVFIGVDSAEKCIARIRTRVTLGGHSVPEADVRRRYTRSLAHLARALRSADVGEVYDNSGDRHRLILIARAGVIVWRAEPLPHWITSDAGTGQARRDPLY